MNAKGISDVGGMAGVITAGQTGISALHGKEQSVETSFMSMLDANSSAGGGERSSDCKIGGTAAQPTMKKNQYMQEKVTNSSKQSVSSVKLEEEELTEIATELQNTVTQGLKEDLQVTDEEIAQAMEELGLSVVDLLEPAKLADLVANLEGQNDSVELLMSGEFQELLRSISEVTESLLAELNLTPEEFDEQVKSLLEQALPDEGTSETVAFVQDITVEVKELPDEPQREEPVKENAVTAEQTVKTDVVNADQQKTEERVENTAGTVEEKPTAETAEAEKTMAVETTAAKGVDEAIDAENPSTGKAEDIDHTAEQASGQQTLTQEEETGKGGASNDGADEGFGKQMQEPAHPRVQTEKPEQESNVQVTTTYTQALGNDGTIVMEQTVRTVNVDHIIRQITEIARTAANNAVTTVQMQLNPENLGHVTVEVTAKAGVITARIAAQDEMVRAAMEQQVGQLRVSMEQQGIKVEAIEVTVETHEFERNLENGQSDQMQENTGESNHHRKKNLNLNEMTLEDLAGLMTEEEQISAKIMMDKGNTMDVSV